MDKDNQYPTGCLKAATETITAAILAIVLLLLILLVTVLLWRKRRAIMRTTVDGIYVQFSKMTHQEVVFLGPVMIPIDQLYLEGYVLIKEVIATQLCSACTLTVHWRAPLKGATNQPGMRPVTIPLPGTI